MLKRNDILKNRCIKGAFAFNEDNNDSVGISFLTVSLNVDAIQKENNETLLVKESSSQKYASTVFTLAESIQRDISSSENALHNSEEHTESSNSQPEQIQSFSIPDGLVMDPLAPTALTVSSEFMDHIGSGLTLLRDHGKKVQKYVWKNRKFDILKKSWKSVVNVVLVEAKDLPIVPAGGTNSLYCKFKLGSENHKSKQVTKTKPRWYERFNLYLYEDSNLEITVWHKGKQKNFMGRCTVDLSQLDKEKTHEFWQELECGYGSLHMLITLSGSARHTPMDNVLTNAIHHPTPDCDDYSWYRLTTDWEEVGQLSVTVHSAKGLSALGISANVDAYCVLELDNSRVQTHTVKGTSEPKWNKNYNFGVKDVTSTLDITIYDESLIGETLGKISIPLLRINKDEKKWFALKDRAKKSSAKGKCPRILLQMSMVWNPIKASFRVLSPKEKKYTIKSENKFSIPLIYSNLKFIKSIFDYITAGNEHLKYLFEWDNREKSALALGLWLVFWYFFQMWMTPLLILIPFIYYWVGHRNNTLNALVPMVCASEDESSEDDLDSSKDDNTVKTRILGLKDLTLTIKNGIDYIVSLIERIKNLINFTVPYLSYLAMTAFVLLALAFYLMPVNYLFMAIGIYKFMRKYLNPNRVPNNDILDFISRVPDDETLKQWRELDVPEPILSRSDSNATR